MRLRPYADLYSDSNEHEAVDSEIVRPRKALRTASRGGCSAQQGVVGLLAGFDSCCRMMYASEG